MFLRSLTPARTNKFLELLFSEEEFICLLRLCLRAHQIVYFLSLKLDRERDPRLAPYSYYRSYEDIRSGMKFIFRPAI